MSTALGSLADRLHNVGSQGAALIGFDGFVDEVVHVVDRRETPATYTRVTTLTEYGRRIAQASGLSINVEIVPVAQKLGGNGPIFALGLKKFGVGIRYIGCTGAEALHPVFHELADGNQVLGVADPGQTDAMEFFDGKIIRSKLDSLNRLNWQSIVDKVPPQALASLMDECGLISFNNWTMIPHMSDIFRHILSDCIPLTSGDHGDKTLFFDLADPEKRSDAERLEALSLIGEFAKSGYKTVLGLNKKEACEIYESLFGKKIDDYTAFPLEELTCTLGRSLGITTLVVHPVDRAACFDVDGYHEQPGPYCAKPALTTGAGDNFNAGFVFGYINGFCADECLTLGCAASGYYVRNAKSAALDELETFLRKWEGGLND